MYIGPGNPWGLVLDSFTPWNPVGLSGAPGLSSSSSRADTEGFPQKLCSCSLYLFLLKFRCVYRSLNRNPFSSCKCFDSQLYGMKFSEIIHLNYMHLPNSMWTAQSLITELKQILNVTSRLPIPPVGNFQTTPQTWLLLDQISDRLQKLLLDTSHSKYQQNCLQQIQAKCNHESVTGISHKYYSIVKGKDTSSRCSFPKNEFYIFSVILFIPKAISYDLKCNMWMDFLWYQVH